MRKNILFYSFLSLLAVALWNCSEKRDVVSVGAHPSGWTDSASAEFHGKLVSESQSGYENCSSCHGEDYKGGTSGVSCYKCHSSYPHDMEWLIPGDANFHGTAVLSSGNNKADCQPCHGVDFKGGTSGKSCFTCHTIYPHPEGFANSGSNEFHTGIMPDILWNVRQACTSCHGSDYKGKGVTEKNCTACHINANGPEACNTCHGNENNNAPPSDRWGGTDISEVTVGVHQKHLTDTSLTVVVMEASCNTCHPAVNDFADPGHLDSVTIDAADIQFSDLARSNYSNPVWDRETGTCSNVYCHGGFSFLRDSSAYQYIYVDSVITGHDSTMIWTTNPADFETDNCALCHPLPPNGHSPISTCSACHQSVSSDFKIIDKSVHINGEKNVF